MGPLIQLSRFCAIGALVFVTLHRIQAGPVVPPAGLVGWWPGDGDARDILGRHHGVLRGGATARTNAMVGTGFSFNGTNRFVEIPNAPDLNPQELTVECWVQFHNLNAPGTSVYPGQQYLVFKQNSRPTDFEGYVLSKDRTWADIILWEVTSSDGELVRIDSTSAVTTNQWYHLAAVRGSNYIGLYFNGVLEAQTNVDFPQDYGNHPLYFGTSGQAYYDKKLNGTLDEVCLYDRALSATEIAALYASGPFGKYRPPIPGIYRGLFREPAEIEDDSSGPWAMLATSRRTFSANLRLGPALYPFSGRFDSNGVAEVTIPRANKAPLMIVLTNSTYEVTGVVASDEWTADLLGHRSVYDGVRNICPQFGRYTAAIPGAEDPAMAPGGDSIAALTVDKAGIVRMSGLLADGTPFTHASTVSLEGMWPLYVPLYGGRGFLMSWVSFADAPGSDLQGELKWTRPPLSGSRYYPSGFDLESELVGSRYAKPARGQRILAFTDGEVTFSGGNLPQSITNSVYLADTNRVINLSSNRFALTFNTGTGTFTGGLIDPSAPRLVSFNGIVIQKANVGTGFFRGTNESGHVYLSRPAQTPP